MTRPAPPDEPAARTRGVEGVGRAALAAAAASAEAVGMLVAVCVLAAAVAWQASGVGDLASWAKGGLLTASLSLRADGVATIRGFPLLPRPDEVVTFGWRFVPMLLTIGFLWLQNRAGRRAAEQRPGRPIWPTLIAAAAGAAVPAAVLAALIAIPVSLSLPSLGVRIRVDVGSAATSAAALAAAGAAVGAFLRAERGGLQAAALRGGVVGYGWSLFLLVVGVVAISALEPAATAAYLGILREQGIGGAVLFGAHVLALPAQSALLLAPASGSCLHLLDVSSVALCPWTLTPEGAGAPPSLERSVALSPWLWALNTVPPIAAALGGRAAARLASGGWVVVGAVSGVAFAALAVVGAWFGAPWVADEAPLVRGAIVRTDLPVLGAVTLVWGLLGGTVGGWIERRRVVRRL